jgi:transposase-like protein
MPWEETNGMNERVRLIASYLEAGGPFSCVCERFGVSRKTGYKWVARYESDGVAGLEERSRAPLSHPHAVASDVVEKILRVREKHPRWGPRKLLVLLERHYPQLALPAASTVTTASIPPRACVEVVLDAGRLSARAWTAAPAPLQSCRAKQRRACGWPGRLERGRDPTRECGAFRRRSATGRTPTRSGVERLAQAAASSANRPIAKPRRLLGERVNLR